MPIPKIIHYCWLSNDPIPNNFDKNIVSWKKYLFDYEFILWNFNRFNIDNSLWVKQASYSKKYAFASDYIRLFAIYHYGGIYLDLDVEILKSFNDLLNNNIMMGYENEKKEIASACFGAEKNHPFILQCLNYYNNRLFIKSNGDYETTPLPYILKYIYNNYSKNSSISFLPSTFFSPKDFSTGLISIDKNTYSIHHFSGSWLSDVEQNFVKERWNFYSKYGNDSYLVNLYKKLVDYEEKDVYKIPIKSLYKIAIKRTFTRITEKCKKLLKK
ncbi:MAG: glycosyl transferase [Treponema sp.]|nr:glycosyl transferase [Treponema sp.]